MRFSELNERLQLLAAVGVLAGLLMVAYELRQNNTLARADAIRSVSAGWETLSISEFESDIATLRAKSFAEPENLTLAEIHKLSSWLTAVQTQYDRLLEMYDHGLWVDSGDMVDDPSFQIADGFEFYLNNPFGRAWYLENRNWMDPKIVEIWDRAMEDSPNNSSSDYSERIKARLQPPMIE